MHAYNKRAPPGFSGVIDATRRAVSPPRLIKLARFVHDVSLARRESIRSRDDSLRKALRS